jgi:hypothetical protein
MQVGKIGDRKSVTSNRICFLKKKKTCTVTDKYILFSNSSAFELITCIYLQHMWFLKVLKLNKIATQRGSEDLLEPGHGRVRSHRYL